LPGGALVLQQSTGRRIFYREKDWPYRRILRACARLLAAKKNAKEETGVPEGKAQSEEQK